LGFAWLVISMDRLGPRFALLNLLAVPFAIYIAQLRSHVNGGYYVGLVTPLLVYAAAVGAATAIDRVAAACVSRLGSRGFHAMVLRDVLLLALAVVTIRGVGTGEIGVGAEDLQILAHRTRDDRLPIFTNSASLVPLLTFERARAGEGSIADAIGPRGDTL